MPMDVFFRGRGSWIGVSKKPTPELEQKGGFSDKERSAQKPARSKKRQSSALKRNSL